MEDIVKDLLTWIQNEEMTLWENGVIVTFLVGVNYKWRKRIIGSL